MREELSMELYHNRTDCEYCDDKKIHVSPNLKQQNVRSQQYINQNNLLFHLQSIFSH